MIVNGDKGRQYIPQFDAIGVISSLYLNAIRQMVNGSGDEPYTLYIPMDGASVRFMGTPVIIRMRESAYLAYRVNPQDMPCRTIQLSKEQYLKHTETTINFIESLEQSQAT